LAFSGIYRVYDQQSFEMVNSRISSSVKLINAVTDRFFTDVANELEAYARTEERAEYGLREAHAFPCEAWKGGES
jgi:hypothetical protein